MALNQKYTSESDLKHADPQAPSSPTKSQSQEGDPWHVYLGGGGGKSILGGGRHCIAPLLRAPQCIKKKNLMIIF